MQLLYAYTLQNLNMLKFCCVLTSMPSSLFGSVSHRISIHLMFVGLPNAYNVPRFWVQTYACTMRMYQILLPY